MLVLDNLTIHIQDIQVRTFGGYNQSINFYYKTMVFKATMLFTQSSQVFEIGLNYSNLFFISKTFLLLSLLS